MEVSTGVPTNTHEFSRICQRFIWHPSQDRKGHSSKSLEHPADGVVQNSDISGAGRRQDAPRRTGGGRGIPWYPAIHDRKPESAATQLPNKEVLRARRCGVLWLLHDLRLEHGWVCCGWYSRVEPNIPAFGRPIGESLGSCSTIVPVYCSIGSSCLFVQGQIDSLPPAPRCEFHR